jgi:hypothetical protein
VQAQNLPCMKSCMTHSSTYGVFAEHSVALRSRKLSKMTYLHFTQGLAKSA